MKRINLDKLKTVIAAKIRGLRQARRWTQVRLAGLLGISQNHLSEIERGDGSFTAEQLLIVLKTFNLQLDYFQYFKQTEAAQVQNALARFGAKSLKEDSGAVPFESIKGAGAAILEALAAAENPRQVTAVAPVIVAQIGRINLDRLRLQVAEAGYEGRLAWALECTLEAVRRELPELAGLWRTKYRRAELVISALLSRWRVPAAGTADDILDREILSEETLRDVRKHLSSTAKKWRIATKITVEDFRESLRGGRGDY